MRSGEGGRPGEQAGADGSAHSLSHREDSGLIKNPGLESHGLDLHLGSNTREIVTMHKPLNRSSVKEDANSLPLQFNTFSKSYIVPGTQ